LRGIPADYDPDDLEPVPTLRQLHTKGLASVLERTTKGEPSILRPTPEGQQLIYDAMARNAERVKRRHHAGIREDREPDG
jgi:hypothetical protein